MTKHIFSVSDILLYQRCPQLFAFEHCAKRRPIKRFPNALDIGTVVHNTCQQLAHNPDLDPNHLNTKELVAICDSLGVEPESSHLRHLESISIQQADWFRHPSRKTEKVLMTEKACLLSLNNPDISIAYRPDLVYRDPEGKVWHRQYKTIFSSKSCGPYVAGYKNSLHEAIYATGLRQIYPDYAGTDLVLFSKDPLHRREKGATCDHCNKTGLRYVPPFLTRHKIDVEPLIHRALNEVEELTYQMAELIENADGWDWTNNSYPALRNTNSCLNYHGGSITTCWALHPCVGATGLTILDETEFEFHDPLARYGDLD